MPTWQPDAGAGRWPQAVTVDCLIWAIGREPATDNFNLAATGGKTNDKGYIIVDKFQNTNARHLRGGR